MSLRTSRRLAVALVAFSTFIDIVAYSIAVPVLPDLSRRLGASPTVIGFLFASFGLTVLIVSLPMGSISDRAGRKGPMVIGMVGLAAASVLFAFSDRLSWLFAARLVQGAADAVTWVVGFALLADLYPAAERGRVMGFVMSSASLGFMLGPTAGGWLYEAGGMRLPFLSVAVAAAAAGVAFAWLHTGAPLAASAESVSTLAVLRAPPVASCAIAVLALGGTLAMIEPVFSLFLATHLHLGPARIGLAFGVGAIINTVAHPVFGRLADHFGGRRLTLAGLAAMAVALPVVSLANSFWSAVLLSTVLTVAVATAVTPSLALMGDAVSSTGTDSFGIAYGLYNFAWAGGLLVGPAVGGFLFEQIGFTALTLLWAPCLGATTLLVARMAPHVSSDDRTPAEAAALATGRADS